MNDKFKKMEWNQIVDEKNGVKNRKNNVKLYLDCIYKNKTYAQTYSSDVFTILIPGVGNSGGFRFKGTTNGYDIKYVVLYSTNKDIYWQDYLDEELGLYVYYGDNKQPGSDLHDKKGNKILRYVFELASSNNIEKRKKIPPFFLFERDSSGGVKFRGLLVPGYETIDSREWLTALWAKRDEGGRFQNYKSLFSVLDTSTGSEFEPNEASINLNWLDDLSVGKGFESKYAPEAWKKWVMNGQYNVLKTYIRPRARTEAEQLPKSNETEKLKMLNLIIDYFREKPTDFEPFAITMATLADDNILEMPYRTRTIRDGGRDGIGNYIIMRNLSNPLKTTFAVEAKCYSINNGVGVKETSRLISRIRQRQFGILVTTSYLGNQAYNEIIEDEHPIAVIAGIDIINILFKIQITNVKLLKKYLEDNYPKNKKI